MLEGLRSLIDSSQNLHQLQQHCDRLQKTLQQRLAEAEAGDTAVLEAALLLATANDRLRARLSQYYEDKRLHMIRNARMKHDTSSFVHLENAFQCDWFSTIRPTLSSTDDGSMPNQLSESGIDRTVQGWNFDKSMADDIVDVLNASFFHAQPHVSNPDYLPGIAGQASTHPSVLKTSTTPSHFDYGFSTTQQPYSFDFEPEASITVVSTACSFAGNDQIRCGTLRKLVERLTDDRLQDLNLRYVFLLTYHSFTNARTLFQILVERYFIPCPPNSTPNEIEYFQKFRQKGIRLKVFSVIKKWVEDHWSDFEQDEELKRDLSKELTTRLSGETWSRKLSATILNVMHKQSAGCTRHTPLMFAHLSPPTEIRTSVTLKEVESRLVEVSPLEMARQLCLTDFEIFRQIHSRECLNQAWSKPDRNVQAANIMRMIKRFNLVSQWTQWAILSASSKSQRQLLLRHMIRIGEHCLSLNNFSSACAIFAGLESTPIHRLRKLFDQLPAKVQKNFDTLQNLFKSDSKTKTRFRTVLQEAIPPCIPHLGLFLSDLTFIEDGNPDLLDGMINFLKRRKLSERIMWIKQYQQIGYQLDKVQAIQEYFGKHLVSRCEDELWKLSKSIQP